MLFVANANNRAEFSFFFGSAGQAKILSCLRHTISKSGKFPSPQLTMALSDGE